MSVYSYDWQHRIIFSRACRISAWHVDVKSTNAHDLLFDSCGGSSQRPKNFHKIFLGDVPALRAAEIATLVFLETRAVRLLVIWLWIVRSLSALNLGFLLIYRGGFIFGDWMQAVDISAFVRRVVAGPSTSFSTHIYNEIACCLFFTRSMCHLIPNHHHDIFNAEQTTARYFQITTGRFWIINSIERL